MQWQVVYSTLLLCLEFLFVTQTNVAYCYAVNSMFILANEYGQESVVSIVACCGVDSLGIKSQWKWHFTDQPWDPSNSTVGTGSFLGVKQLGRNADHPPPSSARLANGLELYFRLFSKPAETCQRWPLPWLSYKCIWNTLTPFLTCHVT
jgi:hypothetical protein